MKNPIRVVRETGGLGDVIRIFAVLDGLAEKFPDRPIHYYGPEKYRDVVMRGHCAGMARPGCEYVETDGLRIRMCRGQPLASDFPKPAIDLNCPAWRHEFETHGAVTRERTALWCEAAGVPVRTPKFILHGHEQINLQWPGIGIHPRSASLLRMWPPSRWRQLDSLLQAENTVNVYWFDDTPDYLRAALDGIIGRKTVIGLNIDGVARAISWMKCMVTVDSALFHLAGALGVPALGLFGSTNGAIISSIYPTARYIQGPGTRNCVGMCYGYSERGMNGGWCLDGCQQMAAITAEDVVKALEEMWNK